MRKFMLILFTMLLALGVAACGNDKVEDAEQDVEKEPIEKVDDGANEDEAETGEDAGAADESGFEDLIIYMGAMGFEMGEPEAQIEGVAESLGAEKGILITVDEIEVQLYLFDPEGANYDEEKYAEAETDHIITIDVGGEKFPIPFLVNGNFGLANHEDHYKGEEIVEAFTNF